MKFILVVTFICAPILAHATNVVCLGMTDYGPMWVEIAPNLIAPSTVTVTGAGLSKPRIFQNLLSANGLITALGLAVSYKNDYGCIRKATIITDLREPIDAGYMGVIEVGTCSGGSIPDRICHPD